MTPILNNLTSITYPSLPMYSGDRPSLVKFNDKIYCTFTSGSNVMLINSSDGIIWSPPIILNSFFTAAIDYSGAQCLVAFNNQLWLGYLVNMSINFITSSDGITWNAKPQPLFGISISFFSMKTFNNILYIAYGGNTSDSIPNPNSGSGYGVSIGLGLNYTSDGSTWSNGGNPTLGGYTSLNNDSTAFMNMDIYSISLADFNGNLYCAFQPQGDSYNSNPPSGLINFNENVQCFDSSTINTNLISGSSTSIINGGNELFVFVWNNSYYGYLAYISRIEGSTWQPITNIPNIYTRMGVSGLMLDSNTLLIANCLTDSNGNGGTFNIITNSTTLNLPVAPPSSTPVAYKINETLTVSSIYPPTIIESVSSSLILGLGNDNYYYFVSLDNSNTRLPIFYQLSTLAPSPMIISPGAETWISFSSNNNLYVIDPATPLNAQTVFKIATNGLTNPVCGFSENEILVQDMAGILHQITVTTGSQYFNFVLNQFTLSPSNGISIYSDGIYLYTYDKTDDMLKVYHLNTTNWGTPYCSSSKLNLASLSNIQNTEFIQNEKYLEMILTINSQNTTVIFEKAQIVAGFSPFNYSNIVVTPISVTDKVLNYAN